MNVIIIKIWKWVMRIIILGFMKWRMRIILFRIIIEIYWNRRKMVLFMKMRENRIMYVRVGSGSVACEASETRGVDGFVCGDFPKWGSEKSLIGWLNQAGSKPRARERLYFYSSSDWLKFHLNFYSHSDWPEDFSLILNNFHHARPPPFSFFVFLAIIIFV